MKLDFGAAIMQGRKAWQYARYDPNSLFLRRSATRTTLIKACRWEVHQHQQQHQHGTSQASGASDTCLPWPLAFLWYFVEFVRLVRLY